jgi:hypothetical protein
MKYYEVDMPDAINLNALGFRSTRLITELVLDWLTQSGGFDITKNNMPFRVTIALKIGAHTKYV